MLYAWPGNVRQLVNEISRIVAFAEPDSTITPALLSPEIQASRRTVRVLPGDEPEIRVRLDQPLNDAVEAIERMMVLRALDRARGNYENAAKLLGISPQGPLPQAPPLGHAASLLTSGIVAKYPHQTSMADFVCALPR